jgi:RNA polymerase sigma factor (TIGR02999 family)
MQEFAISQSRNLDGTTETSGYNHVAKLTVAEIDPRQAEGITGLLKRWSVGDTAALQELTPVVYEHLRQMARNYMRREASPLTLQPTGLVHEAFLRIAGGATVDWQDRHHFFALFATTMRRVLIDAARARQTARHGGDLDRVDEPNGIDFDSMPAKGFQRADELCALDDALSDLARLDPRRAQVIELRFFGGLTVEETAEVLNVSPQTVLRDWKIARAWLTRELQGGSPDIERAAPR